MTLDFTLSKYHALCNALISSGYRSITVQEYIQGQAAPPFVILRYDVDRRPEMTLEMAKMEKEMGIRATYYFRMDGVCMHNNFCIGNIIRVDCLTYRFNAENN